MKSILLSALQPLGVKVILQGTLLNDEPYPDNFITIWTADSSSAADFDNKSALTAWEYQVICYSNNPLMTEEMARDIRKALIAAGFIPQGKGRDLPSDQPTHTGWACNYIYLENEVVV